jgi:hypothetical protein
MQVSMRLNFLRFFQTHFIKQFSELFSNLLLDKFKSVRFYHLLSRNDEIPFALNRLS